MALVWSLSAVAAESAGRVRVDEAGWVGLRRLLSANALMGQPVSGIERAAGPVHEGRADDGRVMVARGGGPGQTDSRLQAGVAVAQGRPRRRVRPGPVIGPRLPPQTG